MIAVWGCQWICVAVDCQWVCLVWCSLVRLFMWLKMWLNILLWRWDTSCLMQPCAAVYVIENVTKYPVVEVRYIQVIGEISTANTLYFIFVAVVLLWPLLLGHLFQSCRKGACGVCCDGELKHRSIDHSKTVADVPCLYTSMINLPPPPHTQHTYPSLGFVTWLLQMDCLDIWNHQRLSVLFSSYSYRSPNHPNPCVYPW